MQVSCCRLRVDEVKEPYYFILLSKAKECEWFFMQNCVYNLKTHFLIAPNETMGERFTLLSTNHYVVFLTKSGFVFLLISVRVGPI